MMKLFAPVLAIGLLVGPLSAQKQTVDVAAILSRAADYVAVYEERQLGNVLASETYVQNYGPRMQRRMESDFLIVLVGKDRMGIRKVNQVDGKPVTSAEPTLEALMDDSPQGVQRRIAALREESSRYNLGPILRQINLPTFALKVVRRQEATRFAFDPHGTDKINGIQGVQLRFQEQRSPTLVHGEHGESLLSSGAVWIEPETGRVLKTELTVENPYADVKGRITVTYAPNKALGILVPEEMKEHYEAGRELVDCTAKYSRFRSFNVDVKINYDSAVKP